MTEDRYNAERYGSNGWIVKYTGPWHDANQWAYSAVHAASLSVKDYRWRITDAATGEPIREWHSRAKTKENAPA